MAIKDLDGHRTGRPKGATTDPVKAGPLAQAVAIQRLAAKSLIYTEMSEDKRAALMRAWCLLDARLSAHRMKPLPKSVDVTKYHAARAAARKAGHSKHAQPSEPKPEPDEQATTKPGATKHDASQAEKEKPKESITQQTRPTTTGGGGGKAGVAFDETPT